MIKLTSLISEKLNIPGASSEIGYIAIGYIPLSSPMMKRLQISKPIKAVHGTTDIGLSWLERIEGSKKSISTATKWDDVFLKTGVGTGVYTVFACLEGNAVVHFDGDVFSDTDGSGRRWMGLHMAKADSSQTRAARMKIVKKVDKLLNSILDKMAKKYNIVDLTKKNSANDRIRTLFGGIKNGNVFTNDNHHLSDTQVNKLKSEIIKLYMDGIEKDVGNDLEWVVNNSGMNRETSGYSWDEVILNSVKIKKVYTTRDFVKKDFDKNQEQADKYPQLKKSKFDIEYVDDIKKLDSKLKKWVK